MATTPLPSGCGSSSSHAAALGAEAARPGSVAVAVRAKRRLVAGTGGTDRTMNQPPVASATALPVKPPPSVTSAPASARPATTTVVAFVMAVDCGRPPPSLGMMPIVGAFVAVRAATASVMAPTVAFPEGS